MEVPSKANLGCEMVDTTNIAILKAVLRDFVLAAVKDDGTGKVRRRYGEDALLP
jgi:hypothetical protein